MAIFEDKKHKQFKLYAMKRNEILIQLEKQFNEDFAGNGYKDEFKPDGTITQCNFGGLLVMLSKSCDSCLVWSDWSDDAISEVLTECEIEYQTNEDSEEDEYGYKESEPGFIFQDAFYSLNECVRCN